MTDSLQRSERTAAAERVLARARRGTEPSANDEERVRRRLHARVLAAPLLLGARGAHAWATLSKLSAAKLLLALGVCGGAALVAGVALQHDLGSFNSAQRDARTASTERAVATAPQRNAPPANAPVGAADTAASVEPAPSVAVPVLAPALAAPAVAPLKRPLASAAPVTSLSAEDMQLEIAGLQRAQQLLHAGNAAQAVATLDQLARQVPAGALMEERAATRVIAWCTLGRSGDSGVEAFLSRYPNSVHSARVRTACSRASFE
jgi:hypothetical protein